MVRIQGTLPRNLVPLERAAIQLRRAVTQELDEAGVQGVASTWGGDWRKPPLPPQCVPPLTCSTFASLHTVEGRQGRECAWSARLFKALKAVWRQLDLS